MLLSETKSPLCYSNSLKHPLVVLLVAADLDAYRPGLLLNFRPNNGGLNSLSCQEITVTASL